MAALVGWPPTELPNHPVLQRMIQACVSTAFYTLFREASVSNLDLTTIFTMPVTMKQNVTLPKATKIFLGVLMRNCVEAVSINGSEI
jgi:hypothetical protein